MGTINPCSRKHLDENYGMYSCADSDIDLSFSSFAFAAINNNTNAERTPKTENEAIASPIARRSKRINSPCIKQHVLPERVHSPSVFALPCKHDSPSVNPKKRTHYQFFYDSDSDDLDYSSMKDINDFSDITGVSSVECVSVIDNNDDEMELSSDSLELESSDAHENHTHVVGVQNNVNNVVDQSKVIQNVLSNRFVENTKILILGSGIVEHKKSLLAEIMKDCGLPSSFCVSQRMSEFISYTYMSKTESEYLGYLGYEFGKYDLSRKIDVAIGGENGDSIRLVGPVVSSDYGKCKFGDMSSNVMLMESNGTNKMMDNNTAKLLNRLGEEIELDKSNLPIVVVVVSHRDAREKNHDSVCMRIREVEDRCPGRVIVAISGTDEYVSQKFRDIDSSESVSSYKYFEHQLIQDFVRNMSFVFGGKNKKKKKQLKGSGIRVCTFQVNDDSYPKTENLVKMVNEMMKQTKEDEGLR